MRLYAESSREALRARKLLKEWKHDGLLSTEQQEQLEQDTVSGLRTTNIFLRIVLLFFTVIAVAAAVGLFFVVGEIRKAIEKSDLGLTPNVDGSTIRLVIPPLNEERRKDLAKVVKKKAEDGRVAVRNVRHRSHDELKAKLKSSEITEDDNKRMQESLQKLTDKYVKEIDALVVAKEKEIMEV